MPSKYPSIAAEPGTYPNEIRELALAKGIGVSDLARVIGVAQMTMYDICSGKRLPSFFTERKLEMLFGIPIADMYKNPMEGLRINLEFLNKYENES